MRKQKSVVELRCFEKFDEISTLPNYRPGIPLSQKNYQSILGWYRFEEKHTCCVQRSSGTLCGTPHNHGWVAKLKDGTVTILGADCANDKFGADSKVFKDIGLAKNAKKAIERERRLQHMLENGTELESRLRETILVIKAARRGVDDFLTKIGAGFRHRIEQMAKNGNSTVVIEGVKTRNYEDAGRIKKEISIIKHSLGNLDGLSAIDRQQFLSLTVEMEDIRASFSDAMIKGSSARTLSTALARSIEQCEPVLQRAAQLNAMVDRFFRNSSWPYCFLTDDRSERARIAKIAMNESGVAGSREHAKVWLSSREAELCAQLGVERIRIT